MKKTFTLIKRALLCCSLGCFATLNADAQSSIPCKFSQDFDNEMQKENITRGNFFFKLSTTAEALDSIEKKEFNYFAGSRFYFRTEQDLSQLTGDSVKVYYSIHSDHIIVEKGEMMAATADLIRERNGCVTFNPLSGSKKMIAKSPTGIDGKPMPAIACFITKHKDGTTSSHGEYMNPYFSLSFENTPEGINNAPFWIKSDLDHVYIVMPQTEPNTPQYLLSTQNISAGNYPDTLTCDYSKAKKITLGMKDLDGNYIDLQRYNLRNKITNVGGHMDGQPGRFEFHQLLQYDRISRTEIEFYAFPGKHYFCYEAFSSPEDYPAGLEGIITVNEQEAAQRIDLDYSNYITLHKKGNAPLVLDRAVCKNKETGNVVNKAEEKLVIDRRGNDYYTRKAIVNGEEVLRFWPGFGYETVDFEINSATYKYEAKNLDIKSTKDYTFDMSDLYEIKINVPILLLNNGYLCANDIDYPRVLYTDQFNVWQHKDFNEQSQNTVFFSKGQYELNLFYKDKPYYSKTINLPEDANKEINFGWKNCVTYSVNPEEITPDEITTFDGTFVDSLQTGNHAQLLYVYHQPGEVTYKVDGPQAGYVPLTGTIKLSEEIQDIALTFAGYKEFKIKYGKNAGVFQAKIDDSKWYGEDGEEKIFEWSYNTQERSVSCFAKPGRIYAPMVCGKQTAVRNSTVFPMEFIFNDTDSLTLTDLNCHVKFIRGEEMLRCENFDRYSTSNADPLDADVHIYALNFLNTQKEMLLKIYLGRKGLGATLFPGFYRAEDRSGNKVYFEVKPEDTEITIDFANPPVPPVGIEDVVNEGNLPAAFYDMSGRQLDAPQKGINIVRMQNGKVKKMIMK